jgi:hypothetical protein
VLGIGLWFWPHGHDRPSRWAARSFTSAADILRSAMMARRSALALGALSAASLSASMVSRVAL